MLEQELKELTQRIAIEFYRAKSMMMGVDVESLKKPSVPLIEVMTSAAATSSQNVSASNVHWKNKAWFAFDGKVDTGWWTVEGDHVTEVYPRYLNCEFKDGLRTVTGYSIQTMAASFHQPPKTWKLQGKDMATGVWLDIHSVVNSTSNVQGEVKDFQGVGEFTSNEFRLKVTAYNYAGFQLVNVGEFQLFGWKN